jgi:MFS family permease
MIVSVFQHAFMMWGFYAWQPYFLELLGRDAVWVSGLVSALIALALIAGNGIVELVGRLCARRTTVLFASTVVLSAGAVGVGVADSFWPAVVLLLVAIGSMGVATPVQQAYVHEVVPSAERATVVSFISMVGSGGGIAGPIGLGHLSRVQSVATGYVVGGLTTLLALPAILVLRRLGEPADAITGGRTGTRAPCAGQGLPEVTTVDATSRRPDPHP